MWFAAVAAAANDDDDVDDHGDFCDAVAGSKPKHAIRNPGRASAGFRARVRSRSQRKYMYGLSTSPAGGRNTKGGRPGSRMGARHGRNRKQKNKNHASAKKCLVSRPKW